MDLQRIADSRAGKLMEAAVRPINILKKSAGRIAVESEIPPRELTINDLDEMYGQLDTEIRKDRMVQEWYLAAELGETSIDRAMMEIRALDVAIQIEYLHDC
jgi:hypothetical protein